MGEGRPLATDGVVVVDGAIVLLRRDHPPDEDTWVLPGGFVERDETARQACAREVSEEVGLAVDVGRFVGLYDDPDRDPRGTVSAAYLCRPRDDGTGEAARKDAVDQSGPSGPSAGEEARAVTTVDPADPPPTGFDHATIIADAAAMLHP